MLAGKIYLKSDDGLVAMTETEYSLEEDLQELIEHYPDLLAGEQMRPGAPRRWLLIEREAGIEDLAGGPARWSLDHLFLDQDAIPTLVEVKRRGDTRIRREVVGQMLDYAANVVEHWPLGELGRRFAARCSRDGLDPEAAIIALLETDDPAKAEAFWESADANLAARRIRLVFLADLIPDELLRIIEFLGASFARAEVFGVEVHQFVGQGHQTLVPRVVGRPPISEAVRATGAGGGRARHWTLDELRTEAASLGGEGVVRLINSVVAWSARHGVTPSIGTGKGGPIYLEAPLPDGGTLKIASVNATNYVLWNYNELAKVPPFDDVELRLECNRRLNAIGGVTIDDRLAREPTWPQLRAEWLAADSALEAFYAVVDWVAASVATAASTRADR